MGTLHGTCEIIELKDKLDSEENVKENSQENHILKAKQKCSIEDDINQLFQTIDLRTSFKGKDSLRRSAMKKPMRVGSPVSGIGISESVSLKQALRGLCISQASEMAAIRRSSKPAGLFGGSEAGTIKRLYRAVVVEAGESGLPLNEGKRKSVEISLVPDVGPSNFYEKAPESFSVPMVESSSPSTSADGLAPNEKMTATKDEILSLSAEVGSLKLIAELVQNVDMETEASSSGTHKCRNVIELDDNIPTSVNDNIPTSVQTLDKASVLDSGRRVQLQSTSIQSSSGSESNLSKAGGSSPRAFWRKNSVKKKVKLDSIVVPSSPGPSSENFDSYMVPNTDKSVCNASNCALQNQKKQNENSFSASSCTNCIIGINSGVLNTSESKQGLGSNCCNKIKPEVTKVDDRSFREKGEFSQSSKSSIGEYSTSSTSISEESSLSGSNRCGNRPHMSKDLRWEAIRNVQKQYGSISIRNFKLLQRLGRGDIGTVYLAELIGTNCSYALKLMDIKFLVSRGKMGRAQTEREIMQMLDHPFLPTLYSHFTTEKLSCLVMEYCPGGDLHVLRQKQTCGIFSEQAARFYVAEILLALEYLHMLGVVYRDLKPENILVREDGHIMLTDFDLSLRCAANPTMLTTPLPVSETPKKTSNPCTESSCIDPFCLQPSWQVSCFTPRLQSAASKSQKLKSDIAVQVNLLPQLVVEPTSARSHSFVGTHEYLAPEIIKGEGHGSAVDWWTLGIFLFELLYGKTPFKGNGNHETIANAVSHSLKFPEGPVVSFYARDLIRGLLVKEQENRLGSKKGAAEIKQHPFFEGMNWALVRCARPPELPKFDDVGIGTLSPAMASHKNESLKLAREESEFEVF